MSEPRWQSLSGDEPTASRPRQPTLPSGWQAPLRDEEAEYRYPYAPRQDLPAQLIVEPQELAAVELPRYQLPVRPETDPGRQRLASFITFATLLVALWSIVSFTGTLSATLGDVSRTTDRIMALLATANVGLAQLDEKIAHLDAMADDTATLKARLTTIDSDMGGMLDAVDVIATNMEAMDGSITTLDGQLTQVDAINRTMVGHLGTIDSGLSSELGKVRALRRDVRATDGVLRSLGGRLDATNDRLTYVNSNVNIMGCRGIGARMKANIFVGPLRAGSANVMATVSPIGAWGHRPGGGAC